MYCRTSQHQLVMDIQRFTRQSSDQTPWELQSVADSDRTDAYSELSGMTWMRSRSMIGQEGSDYDTEDDRTCVNGSQWTLPNKTCTSRSIKDWACESKSQAANSTMGMSSTLSDWPQGPYNTTATTDHSQSIYSQLYWANKTKMTSRTGTTLSDFTGLSKSLANTTDAYQTVNYQVRNEWPCFACNFLLNC